jgi:nitroimidazol reductase NimA-like FMN-containing flavoprotein (pyridoxamine 5'-phosphate oxidase superfamily)
MKSAHEVQGPRIPPERCWSLLDRTRVGRIATLDGDQPLVVVVPFALDQGDIVIGAKAGSGLSGLWGREVAFEVDDIDAGTEAGWSVVVRGPAYDVTDTVDRRSERLQGVDVSCWCMDGVDGRIVIRPREVSGHWLRAPQPRNAQLMQFAAQR